MHVTRNQYKSCENRFEIIKAGSEDLQPRASTGSNVSGTTSALQLTKVRSTTGLLPKIVVLYMLLRIVSGQVLAYDTGVVPGRTVLLETLHQNVC